MSAELLEMLRRVPPGVSLPRDPDPRPIVRGLAECDTCGAWVGCGLLVCLECRRNPPSGANPYNDAAWCRARGIGEAQRLVKRRRANEIRQTIEGRT